MEIVRNYKDGKVVESYDIYGLTSADMCEITRMLKRLTEIRVNHITSDKKEYLSDAELLRIEAILDTMTEGHRVVEKKSIFDERVELLTRSNEALRKMKAARKPIEEWNDEAIDEQPWPSTSSC